MVNAPGRYHSMGKTGHQAELKSVESASQNIDTDIVYKEDRVVIGHGIWISQRERLHGAVGLFKTVRRRVRGAPKRLTHYSTGYFRKKQDQNINVL